MDKNLQAETIRVGIVGVGLIAKIHCPAIAQQPNAVIVGVAHQDLGRARVLAAELATDAYYRDPQVMIEEQDPDVVQRRTELGAGGLPDEESLRTCANLMAGELGWDRYTRPNLHTCLARSAGQVVLHGDTID
jgi:hypothetical protein